jgi:WD40 repeat protein/tRNA A-37 threonylcarbamoyl transferase component Bud32
MPPTPTGSPKRTGVPPDPATAETLPPLSQDAAPTEGSLLEERVNVPGYEILRELGRGGMGVVYLARQQKLNRLVALKMILAGGHASDSDLARFLAEAEAVAQLQHPNVVSLLESGQHDGLPYFTLEYVGGGSFAERLRGTPLPPRDAAVLVAQLARGIQAAHERDIVHRDLKPANVLLSGDGTPRLTDFGLARRVQTAQKGLTATGAILGTPSYMAPEQAEGKGGQVGPPADIYSLGAILYECLTGRPPFQGPTPLETLAQVVSDEPVPPTRLVRAVPRDVETICLKCLQKTPQRRYATALELAEDLTRFARGEPIVARPVGRLERAAKWARRKPATAALLTVSLLAALGLTIGGALFTLKLDQARADAEAERDRAKDMQEQLRSYVGVLEERDRFLVQRNLLLAQIAWRANNLALAEEMLDHCPQVSRHTWEWRYLKCVCSGRQFSIFGTTGNAVFSPDGHFLASGGLENTVKVWDASTGREVLTLRGHRDTVNSVAFSPDGQQLASGSSDTTVRLWDARSGKPIGTLALNAGNVRFVTYSPDGKRLAVSALTRNEQMDLTTGRRVSLWDVFRYKLLHEENCEAVNGDEVSFSPDGRTLISPANVLQPWNTETGLPMKREGGEKWANAAVFSPDGQHIALAFGNNVSIQDRYSGRETRKLKGHEDTIISLSYSPDRRRVATASLDRTVRIWDLGTEQEIATIRGIAHPWFTQVRFSPDGQRLAVNGYDGTLKVLDARSGPEAIALKFGVVSPMISSDGRTVTAISPNLETITWDAGTGHELVRRAVNPGEQSIPRAASRDGRFVARGHQDGTITVTDLTTNKDIFQAIGHKGEVNSICIDSKPSLVASGGADKRIKLWDVNSGREPATLAETRDWSGPLCFSNSGRLLAGSVDGEIRIWDTSARQLVKTINSDAMEGLCFSPDEQSLAFATWTGASVELKVWDLREDREIAALRGHTNQVSCMSYTHDGARLASGDSGGTLKLWDLQTRQEVLSVKAHVNGVAGLTFSPENHHLATIGGDGIVKIWDARPAQGPRRLPGHRDQVTELSFGRDGAYLASTSKDRTIRVWEARTGRPISSLEGHAKEVKRMTFSPDNALLASASDDRTVRVWDIATGRQIHRLEHDMPPSGVLFSPDGHYLASDGTTMEGNTASGAFKVWDALTGKEVLKLEEHTRVVREAAFTPDSLYIVVSFSDNKPGAWHLQSGAKSTLPDPMPTWALFPPSAPIVSPDGRFFAISQGKDVLLMDIEPSPEDLAFRRAIAQIDPAWQDQQAIEAEQAHQWFAVAFHLDRVEEAGKAYKDHHKRRGQARAILGRWDGAIADFTKALEGAPADERVELWNGVALAQVGAGHTDDYRQTCARMVEQLPKASDVPLVGMPFLAISPLNRLVCLPMLSEEAVKRIEPRRQVTRCCAAGPNAGADILGLLRLAPFDDKELRGAILYRAAKYDEAAKLLADSKDAPGLLYLALAEKGRGQTAEAKQALDRAVRWLDAPSASDPKQSNESMQSALLRLETLLIRREAEARLKK